MRAVTPCRRAAAALKAEGEPGDPPAPLAAVVADVGRIIEAAMDQLRATRRATPSSTNARLAGRVSRQPCLASSFTPPSTQPATWGRP